MLKEPLGTISLVFPGKTPVNFWTPKLKANFKNRDKLELILKRNKIEFRRGNAGGGNQIRQPYLSKFTRKIRTKQYKEVDHIHFFGYYIGNYPSLGTKKIIKLCNILNSIIYEF